jgi:hypothetical protein
VRSGLFGTRPKPIHAEPVPLLKAPGRRVSPLLAVVHGDRVERFPYAVREHAPPRDGAHVVVDATYPAGRYSALADVLVRDAHGAPDDWPARMLARHPGLGVAALIDGQVCRMTARDGTVSEAVAPRGTDPSALASLAYDRLSSEP